MKTKTYTWLVNTSAAIAVIGAFTYGWNSELNFISVFAVTCAGVASAVLYFNRHWTKGERNE